MKPKPVKRYRIPSYPTKLNALSDPKLLEKNMPAAWQRGAEMAGAVTFFLAANAVFTGCDKSPFLKTGAPAVVAPVSMHGDGRGAVGCIVIAPPVFLSEGEALLVIKEEMSRHGIDMSEKDIPLSKVVIKKHIKENGRPKLKIRKESGPLEADLGDSEHEILVEFISVSDYFDLGGIRSHSTVQDFHFQPVAKSVAERVEKNETDIYFGTFFDPMVTNTGPFSIEDDDVDEWGYWRYRRYEERSIEAKRLLRLQVRDFADWLKAQGVI